MHWRISETGKPQCTESRFLHERTDVVDFVLLATDASLAVNGHNKSDVGTAVFFYVDAALLLFLQVKLSPTVYVMLVEHGRLTESGLLVNEYWVHSGHVRAEFLGYFNEVVIEGEQVLDLQLNLHLLDHDIQQRNISNLRDVSLVGSTHYEEWLHLIVGVDLVFLLS